LQLDLFRDLGSLFQNYAGNSRKIFLFEIATLHLSVFPQLKLLTFCCLAYHFFLIVQFSRYNVDRSSVSFAATQACLLFHFALSPFPRRPARAGLCSEQG